MSKRVLSICLAVLIMAMAIPMSIFAPAVSAAQDGEINLSSISFPSRVKEKVIHDFADATEANVGGASSSNRYGYVQATVENTAFSFENQAAKLSITADAKQPYNYFYFSYYQGNSPTANTKYLAIHIDFTGVKSLTAGTKIGFRTAICGSRGGTSMRTMKRKTPFT